MNKHVSYISVVGNGEGELELLFWRQFPGICSFININFLNKFQIFCRENGPRTMEVLILEISPLASSVRFQLLRSLSICSLIHVSLHTCSNINRFTLLKHSEYPCHVRLVRCCLHSSQCYEYGKHENLCTMQYCCSASRYSLRDFVNVRNIY
jgi:hypothetical protein